MNNKISVSTLILIQKYIRNQNTKLYQVDKLSKLKKTQHKLQKNNNNKKQNQKTRQNKYIRSATRVTYEVNLDF